jgi:hypothetical protein
MLMRRRGRDAPGVAAMALIAAGDGPDRRGRRRPPQLNLL